MVEKIIIDPVTRISGFMEIEADVKNNFVADVKTKGLMFRGFEKMLIGRSPFDAVYFTQRICGICSSAHAVASSLALEDALHIIPSEQGSYLRDIIHGCECLQNHLRQFFQLTLPDFVNLPKNYPLFINSNRDYRLPKNINDKMVADYFSSLDLSRKSHQMLAILGGKAPHNHGVFIGGITTEATIDKIIALKSMLSDIEKFVNEIMVPDVYEIAKYYGEYYHVGKGYGNFLSFGYFNGYKELGTLYVDPLVYTNNTISKFNADNIAEESEYAYYDTGDMPDSQKPQAYSWIKAPRYNGKPFEVGPLARMWLCGDYRNGISAMDRIIARVLETRKVVSIINILIDNLQPNIPMQKEYVLPDKADGKGLVDTTRGALAHYISIENKKISFYQLITPSAWNLSSQTGNMKGTAEMALMGTHVGNTQTPVEIGRIIRSFDPCVSCATHVYTGGELKGSFQIM